MPKKNSIRELLTIADGDFRAAQALRMIPDIQMRTVGFFLQQAAEKSIKSWALLLGEIPDYTHDINRLLGSIERVQPVPEEYWQLAELTPYGVQFRYVLEDITQPFDYDKHVRVIGALMAYVEELAATRGY